MPTNPLHPLLRSALLAASRSAAVRRAVETFPPTRRVAGRFVAGADTQDALRAVKELANDGLLVTVDHLGEDITDASQAEATVAAYLELVSALDDAGMATGMEVSVKLSALGQSLPGDGEAAALGRARRIVTAATRAGMLVTLDMEDHTTTDSTLRVLAALRAEVPSVGCVLQAALLRTEDDARRLAVPGSRVRLTKGAYREPAAVAHQEAAAIDAAYRRALEILMRGDGYVMVASHDPAMVAAAERLVQDTRRTADSYELQMLYGVRPVEQLRLARAGHRMRVYVPYGDQWYGYFMRRLAERPANLALFLRSLRSRH